MCFSHCVMTVVESRVVRSLGFTPGRWQQRCLPVACSPSVWWIVLGKDGWSPADSPRIRAFCTWASTVNCLQGRSRTAAEMFFIFFFSSVHLVESRVKYLRYFSQLASHFRSQSLLGLKICWRPWGTPRISILRLLFILKVPYYGNFQIAIVRPGVLSYCEILSRKNCIFNLLLSSLSPKTSGLKGTQTRWRQNFGNSAVYCVTFHQWRWIKTADV